MNRRSFLKGLLLTAPLAFLAPGLLAKAEEDIGEGDVFGRHTPNGFEVNWSGSEKKPHIYVPDTYSPKRLDWGCHYGEPRIGDRVYFDEATGKLTIEQVDSDGEYRLLLGWYDDHGHVRTQGGHFVYDTGAWVNDIG